jgi:hypothetical protein
MKKSLSLMVLFLLGQPPQATHAQLPQTMVPLVSMTGGSREVSQDSTALEENFQNPPQTAKPHTWWHWMNGHVSKEGITADLEAMQRVGIGGVQAFHVSNSIPSGPVAYMSEEWRRLMKHAIEEANRLGLEFCFHNTPGWSSSGGVWITPELSMKEVVYAEKQVKGPLNFTVEIDQPENRLNFYRDIAILAFPTPRGERGASKGFRLLDWEQKAGIAEADSMRRETRKLPKDDAIPLEKIVNLTGNKTWNVPAGEWTIIRFGYTTTGVTNRQSPPEVLGLECDKLSSKAAKFHWDQTVAKVMADAGELNGKTLNNILIDSYEVKRQNWTEGLDDQFNKKLGYNLINYLPCLTGRVVESVDVSERMLWDFRRTIADLFVEKYIGTFAELCHANGMLLSVEPYGPGNFNHMEVGVKADIPMGEFWNNAPDRYSWTNKLAASAAHVNNHKVVGAEAFTSAPKDAWDNYPGKLKEQGDWAFTQGINRFIFHTFAHQPWEAVKPGMTMGPHGMMGNRNTTWWEQGGAWIDYLSRCQYLLQQGRVVVDLCYVLSEDVPVGNSLPYRHGLTPSPPPGYDYDVLDAGSVMKMTVEDGTITLPGGMKYKVLVLHEKQSMRPSLAKKINELIRQGAQVVGTPLQRSPSLENYPKADVQVKSLSALIPEQTITQSLAKIKLQPDALFSFIYPAQGQQEEMKPIEYIHRKTDEGDIYFISNQNDRAISVNCLFRVAGMQPELWYPHLGTTEPAANYRQSKDGRTEVSLAVEKGGSLFVVFRKPITNLQEIASFTHNNSFPLQASLHSRNGILKVSASSPGKYVAKTVSGKEFTAVVEDVPAPYFIAKGWQLHFPKTSGAPAQVALDDLISWSAHDNRAIKHFSGTATYKISFELPASLQAKLRDPSYKVRLSLGEVAVIADARLNEQDLGVLWKAPFEVEITDQLKEGSNKLEVRVTNLWVNRMIGDDALPEDAAYSKPGNRGRSILEIPDWVVNGTPRPSEKRQTFSTWLYFDADAPLLSSGLIGPVKLVFTKVVAMEPALKQGHKNSLHER